MLSALGSLHQWLHTYQEVSEEDYDGHFSDCRHIDGCLVLNIGAEVLTRLSVRSE